MKAQAPELSEPLRGRLAGALFDVGDQDRRALLQKTLGDAVADAARRADDDRDPVLQSVAHCLPSVYQRKRRRTMVFSVSSSTAASTSDPWIICV